MADDLRWIPWEWSSEDKVWEWSIGNLIFWLYEMKGGEWRWEVFDHLNNDKSLCYEQWKVSSPDKALAKADKATVKYSLDKLAEQTGWDKPKL
jgi:hypothetical protein